MSFWKTLKAMVFGPDLKTQFNDILEAQEVAEKAVEKIEEAVEEVKEVIAAPAKPKRARTPKGKLQADNPTTPEVNEAWEGGKAPAKKAKKPVSKKKKK